MIRVHPTAWVRSTVSLAAILLIATSARADAPATRIVSVGGAITEIIYALGEQDRLVARDVTSNFPAQARELPDVGYIRRLSPEGILSVNPDLIIAQEGAGPPETIELLNEAQIPMVEIPEGFAVDAVIAKIDIVSNALGVPEKGAALAAGVRKDIEAARLAARDLKSKRVLFILSMQGDRVLAGGSNSAAQGIIDLVGAENAVSGFEGYKMLTDEAIVLSEADVVLLMDRTGDMGVGDEQLFAHPAIASTPAGQAKSVIRMDGMLMLGFSVRTAEAVSTLAQALQETGS